MSDKLVTVESERNRIDRLKQEQRQRWRQGQPQAVEDYLRAYPSLSSQTESLLELIYNEVLLREQRGETPTLAEYSARFPLLAGELALQFQAHEALGPAGDATPSWDEGHPKTLPMRDARPAATPELDGYEVLEQLGAGGMGVVYKARQKALNRLVALKLVLAGREASAEELFLFRREAEALGRLKHANVVQVYDYGEYGGQPFMTMELVEGTTLQAKLEGGPLATGQAAALLVESLARAVQVAHSHGLIHRDLKPANVLLAADGTPKISDFGLARHVQRGTSTGTRWETGGNQPGFSEGKLMGTPAYMAPEQAEAQYEAIGPATDVYALGGILYAMLTSRPPQPEGYLDLLLFMRQRQRMPPSALRRGLDSDLEAICLKCLAWDGEQRYPSALELAEDLARYQRGEPVGARTVGSFERLTKWVRRRPTVAGLVAGLVLVTLLGVAGILWKYVEAEGQRDKAVRAEQTAKEETEKATLREKSEREARLAVATLEADSDRVLRDLLEEAMTRVPLNGDFTADDIRKDLEFRSHIERVAAHYDRALRNNPETDRFLAGAGMAHYLLLAGRSSMSKLRAIEDTPKEYDAVETMLRRALRHDIADKIAQAGLAGLCVELGRWHAAVETPWQQELSADRRDCAAAQTRFTEARSLYASLSKNDPEFAYGLAFATVQIFGLNAQTKAIPELQLDSWLADAGKMLEEHLTTMMQPHPIIVGSATLLRYQKQYERASSDDANALLYRVLFARALLGERLGRQNAILAVRAILRNMSSWRQGVLNGIDWRALQAAQTRFIGERLLQQGDLREATDTFYVAHDLFADLAKRFPLPFQPGQLTRAGREHTLRVGLIGTRAWFLKSAWSEITVSSPPADAARRHMLARRALALLKERELVELTNPVQQRVTEDVTRKIRDEVCPETSDAFQPAWWERGLAAN